MADIVSRVAWRRWINASSSGRSGSVDLKLGSRSARMASIWHHSAVVCGERRSFPRPHGSRLCRTTVRVTVFVRSTAHSTRNLTGGSDGRERGAKTVTDGSYDAEVQEACRHSGLPRNVTDGPSEAEVQKESLPEVHSSFAEALI
jgi:hypothetical protein